LAQDQNVDAWVDRRELRRGGGGGGGRKGGSKGSKSGDGSSGDGGDGGTGAAGSGGLTSNSIWDNVKSLPKEFWYVILAMLSAKILFEIGKDLVKKILKWYYVDFDGYLGYSIAKIHNRDIPIKYDRVNMGCGKDKDDIKEWVQDVYQTFGLEQENFLQKDEFMKFFDETLKLAGLDLLKHTSHDRMGYWGTFTLKRT
jgi:hypothetical protein